MMIAAFLEASSSEIDSFILISLVRNMMKS